MRTATRRVFLASSAAIVATGAAGGAALLGQGRSTGRRETAVQREIKAQLRDGLKKLKTQDPNAARQLATTIRIYAATVDDALLMATLPKVNRATLLRGAHPHAEIARLAKELGVDPSQLPATTLGGDEPTLAVLLREGVSARMRAGADALDRAAIMLEKKKAGLLVVSARQCQDCKPSCDAAVEMDRIVAITCAASAVFPALVELCIAVSATWLTFYIACALCDFGGAMFDYC